MAQPKSVSLNDDEKVTPMMEQYYHFKKIHHDKFVFFRLGDFYELFLDDALEASKLLSLTLTQRGGKPMCGIPHHQLYVYTAKLIEQGKKIVVVDQSDELTDGTPVSQSKVGSKSATKIVKREIAEILTPGTTHEWNTLSIKENNYLLALTAKSEDFFLLPVWIACVLDVSTGEVEIIDWGRCSERSIVEKIITMKIREILIDDAILTPALKTLLQDRNELLVINAYSAHQQNDFSDAATLEKNLHTYYNGNTSPELFAFTLKKHWGMLTANLKQNSPGTDTSKQADPTADQIAKSLSDYKQYLEILARLLHYAGKEQCRTLSHLKMPTLTRKNDYLMLDSNVIKNLELFRNNYDDSSAHTLVAALDHTRTAMGARLLRRIMMRPLARKDTIEERLERVSWFCAHPLFLEEFRKQLGAIQDIERLIGRLGMSKLSPKELRALAKSLSLIGKLFQSFITEEAHHVEEHAQSTRTENLGNLKNSENPENSENSQISSDFFWDGEGFYALSELLQGQIAAHHSHQNKRTAHSHKDTRLHPAAIKDTAQEHATQKSNPPQEPPRTQISQFNEAYRFFMEITDEIDQKLLAEPNNDFTEGGVICETAHADLQKFNQTKRDFNKNLSKLWSDEKQKTGIATLKLKFTDNLGYFFEVTKSHLASVPDYFQRKQTLMGGERFVTTELLTLEKSVRENSSQIVDIERRLYAELIDQVRRHIDSFQKVAVAIGYLDIWSNFAQLALKYKYTRPSFVDNATFIYKEGRHPVIEQIEQEPFVANSLAMNKQTSVLHIITGPNMAGKSTFLRQTALLAIMAHMGSFIPVKLAQFPVLDRVFTRIGSSDRLSKGESTFLVEMNETAEILHNATHHSLVIMDEIGRGTSTYDGLSIAWSVLEYLTQTDQKRPYTLFATHYHEITELSHLEGVENYTLNIREEGTRLLFLRRVVEGCAGKSYGIHVARLAGLPQAVILKAKERLRYFEKLGSSKDLALQETPLLSNHDEILDLEAKLETERAFRLKLQEFFSALDINKLTPLQALQKLGELQQKFKD